MDNELKNILTHLNKRTDQETLLRYINRQLDKDELHALEKHLLDDSFENDAVEGLQSIDNKKKISAVVNLLNRDLKKKIGQRKKRFQKSHPKPQWLLSFCILILLIILVLIYLLMHRSI